MCVCVCDEKKKTLAAEQRSYKQSQFPFFFSFPLISKQLLDTENNKNKTEQTNKQQKKKRTRDIAGKKKATGWQVSHLSITKEKKKRNSLIDTIGS